MIHLDLSRNEMPYPPPERVIKAAERATRHLNRYADPDDMDKLTEVLANYSNVSKENVILAPGSDMLLREMIRTFSIDREIVTINPSFFPTIQAAKKFGQKVIKIQLTPPDFKLDYNILSKLQGKACLTVIDSPNNPTGKVILDRDMVEDITGNSDALLIIDEAYFEFSGISFSEMINEFPNLSITRSLDKAFSLAGCRIGYIIAGDYFLDGLSDFYTFISRPGLFAALEAMKDPVYAQRNVSKLIDERNWLMEKLEETDLKVYSSETNFLLVKSDNPDFAGELRERGVLVLDLSSQWIPGYFRVSVGSRKENKELISIIHSLEKRG